MRKIAIVQSNYIPWKGYFDLIAAVDEFIIYDDVQFTKNDWRNRNKIKTQSGLKWISVPVGQDISRKIQDVEIKDRHWQTKHWSSIAHAYKRANYFDTIANDLEPLYLDREYSHLSVLNRTLIEFVCAKLCIQTKISNSSDYDLVVGKTDRLISLCEQVGADIYVSGPSGRNYLNEAAFLNAGILVKWFEYEGYPEYSQLWGNFEHNVSIIDLLFNHGLYASKYMKHVINVDSYKGVL